MITITAQPHPQALLVDTVRWQDSLEHISARREERAERIADICMKWFSNILQARSLPVQPLTHSLTAHKKRRRKSKKSFKKYVPVTACHA